MSLLDLIRAQLMYLRYVFILSQASEVQFEVIMCALIQSRGCESRLEMCNAHELSLRSVFELSLKSR